MSEVVRLYRYKALFSGRRALSIEDLMARLETSRATVKRDIAKLRDQLHVPIRFDRDRGGYVIDEGPGHTDSELPGLWFSPEEVLALVTIQELMVQLAPGMLGPKLKPLHDRLTGIMAKNGLAAGDVANRIRLTHAAGKRQLKPQSFEAIASATLGRRQVRAQHFNRATGQKLERVISPQRLVHYRDNWYVDAWCHLREDLRSFSVDALSEVQVLQETAKEIEPRRVDEMMGSSYGIFAGLPKASAVLKFSAARARWVRREVWHPHQESREHPDGSYELSIPYSDEREILGDILRFGADVSVLAPADLRRKVQQAALLMVNQYVQ